MKTLQFWLSMCVALLTACGGAAQPSVVTPTALRVERINIRPINIIGPTNTPPRVTPTVRATAAAAECYRTARTQRDLNTCAAAHLTALEQQLPPLLKLLAARYQASPAQLKMFWAQQAEWVSWAKSMCALRAHLAEAAPGTLAPMNYAQCLASKYETRLRAYERQLWEWPP